MEIEEKAFYEAMKQNIRLSEQLRVSIRLLWTQMITISLMGIIIVIILLVVMGYV